MTPIISVSNVSKQYRLGEVGTGSFQQDLNRWWHKLRGKEDPYLQVGDTNDRSTRGHSDYIWALQHINFEVQQGEVLGIIGRNGAGKSTLLKILSRVTEPTTGRIAMRGRVASLLEVGTGFHPDLTGRENIYLNGAILGMTKKEITRKFDEIVDFAGVERYIDTPVKRYSSGMHVRLGFAVAAHLEPEILIVDEVLAVGDAEFQKKCLGKMKSVSTNEGRTVLFVSHNMEAVKNLCTTGLVLQNGTFSFHGSALQAIEHYQRHNIVASTNNHWSLPEAPGNLKAKLLSVSVVNPKTDDSSRFDTTTGFHINCIIQLLDIDDEQLDITIHLVDEKGILVLVTSTAHFFEPKKFSSSELHCKIEFPANILNEGIYSVSRLLLVKDRGTVITEWNDTVTFEIEQGMELGFGWQGQKEGVIRLSNIQWQINTEK
ncbi:MAG: ABC transporter ATP-binding protein [Bacteroidetes bacterium]|uniref:ABC transporter ATP-binding protein n=1 Tax=Phnomibacter sp. TaxID=2836217 RepID=UPI002FDCD5FB|nr:ABC transporter ATP-binding protein [Bacteroidota bacterium]